MRVYNPSPAHELRPRLLDALARLRAERAFDAASWCDAKATALNEYMIEHHLAHCVIGVSGGIDSALVVQLAAHARDMDGSPICRILALMMPAFDPGATDQEQATRRGHLAAEAAGAEACPIDLTGLLGQMAALVEGATGMRGSDWARGQLVAYLRTPALYYATSLLTDSGDVGIVLGTTNRDEGGYLGYFGKASDGMVDVQVISDLHKREVRLAAEYLGVPGEIIQAVPAGDMFDGRDDEQVFGAPYDFVELYLMLLCLDDERNGELLAGWDAADLTQYEELAAHLERLHAHNAHKYLGRSPAVHLDLLPAGVPGGWPERSER